MNLHSFKEKKPFIIILFVSLLLVIGLLGGKWQQAYATSSIPLVDSITPNEVLRNSSDVTFTILGADFLGEWDVEFTRIRWSGPDGQVVTVAPESVNLIGTEIVFELPYSFFQQVGTGEVEVINNYNKPDLIQISDKLYVNIVDLTFLPFLAK